MLLGLLAPLLGPVIKGTLGKIFGGDSRVSGAVEEILGGIKSDPKLRMEAEKIALEHAKTILDYEGKAADMPYHVKLARGLTRPGVVLSGWVIFVTAWLIDFKPPPDFLQTAWIGFTSYWFVSRAREKGMRW